MPFDSLSRYRKRATGVLAALTTILCLLNNAVTVQMAQQQPDSPSARPELVLQTGHTGKVNAIAFSPDGKTLASGGDDKTVKLWDIKTGELKRTLVRHGRKVDAIVFSRDGKTLASDGADGVSCGTGDGSVGEIILWDTQTWAVKRRLPISFYKSFSIAFSPNIQTVVTSNDDGSTQVYDAATGILRRTLRGIQGVVAFSPDGHTFASAGSDGTVELRDARTGKVRRTLRGPDPNAAVVAFSPDGKLITRAGIGELAVWNTRTGEILQTVKVDVDRGIFSRDGRSLASWSARALTVYDTRTWQVKRTLGLPEIEITAVALSSDLTTLAIAGVSEPIKLYNVRTGTMRMLTRREQYLKPSHLDENFIERRIDLSPDGLTAAMGSGNTVSLWNTQTGEVKQTLIEGQGFVISVAFSPDGKLIASGSEDNIVRLWDAQTGRLKRTMTGPTEPNLMKSVRFLPDGRTVVAINEGGSKGSELMSWEIQTGKRKATPIGHFLEKLASSTDGKAMATWNGYEVMLVDTSTGKARKMNANDGEYIVSQVVLSPDSKVLAAAQSCGLVTLWDAGTGAVRKKIELMNASEDVLSIALSPDGKTGASGCSDNSVKVWDVLTGKVKATLKGHSDNVDWVAFLPDGKALASGSYDNTLKIWEPNSGRLLATLMVLPPSKKGEASEWIAFTPEGYYTGSTGAARFIRWRVGDQLAPAATYEGTFHRPDLVGKSLRGEQ